ncbi:MAG: hypothetical protein ACSLE0_20790 [Chitinophagaceae bacterium]
MNNYYAMSASFETRKNTQATMITTGFAGLLLLLMFFWTWTLPAIIPPMQDQGIMVELNLPDEPPIELRQAGGGGGGGNPVQAIGERGTAPYSPPQPGTEDDAKDIEEDLNEKVSPAILKPDNPKPTATKINENKSIVKTEPVPDPKPPAPPKPKAVLGKTTSGTGTGGGAAENYERSGGTGQGSGVGNGNGTGGGSGTGSGGGTGSGTGTGVGPRVTKGDRRIISSYSFVGDLDKATIYADIKVSPDGVGSFENFAKGSSSTSSAYRNEIVKYLRNIKFNKSDHESTVTVQFNFRVNG